MLLLGFYSLGTIDTNWAGLGLIVFAFILFASDVFLPTHGILTVGGIIAFVVGGLILANSSDNQAIQLSQGLVYTIAIAMGIFFLTVVGAAARARRWPPKSGPSTVLGTVGVARTPLNPSGMIFLNGELWQATSLDGPIAQGEQVRVAALRGIQLDVVPLTSERGTPVDPAPSPA
jgi:membrane-bound serine protease (ClpP class)